MKPRNIIAVCCGAVLAALLGMHHPANQPRVEPQKPQPLAKPVPEGKDNQPDKPIRKVIEDVVLASLDAQMPDYPIEEDDVDIISELPAPMLQETISSAWTFSDFDPSPGKLKLDERVLVKQPISFHRESVEQVSVGTQVQFSLPEGEQFSATVEKVQVSGSGSRSWSGHLDGFGNSYPVIFTSGNNTGFATITTPNGSYTLESVNGSGWIYKNPTVGELTEPGAEDFLLIDDYRHVRKPDHTDENTDENTEEYIEEYEENTEQQPVKNS